MKSILSNNSSNFILSKLLQICIIASLLTYFSNYFYDKEILLKYLVYFSLLVFSISLYLKSLDYQINLNQHFNQLFLNILIYLMLITFGLSGYTEHIAIQNALHPDYITYWCYISVDFFQNLILIFSIILIFTLFTVFYLKTMRKNRSFIIKLIGTNLILLCIICCNYLVIYFFKNHF